MPYTTGCNKCWWQEGGLCYKDPVKRDKNGRSLKPAESICDNFWDREDALLTVIPKEKLIILSRLNRH